MSPAERELAAWERRVEYLEAEATALKLEGSDDYAIYQKAIPVAFGMVQHFRRELEFDRAGLHGTDRPGHLWVDGAPLTYQ